MLHVRTVLSRHTVGVKAQVIDLHEKQSYASQLGSCELHGPLAICSSEVHDHVSGLDRARPAFPSWSRKLAREHSYPSVAITIISTSTRFAKCCIALG